MPFDEDLARRTRSLIGGDYALEEKRMFGGLAFMVNGHMCCGISGKDLMVRVGPDIYERALKRPNTRPMDFTGRPLARIHPCRAGRLQHRGEAQRMGQARSGLRVVVASEIGPAVRLDSRPSA